VKITGGGGYEDPLVLDLNVGEAARLAYVSMLLLATDPTAPCVPSHWFCAGVKRIPDEKLAEMYDGRGESEEWFVRASRRVFRSMSWCPEVDGSGFTRDEMEEWIEAALARTDMATDYVQVVYDLGIALGGEVRLDA
jgi:hypothetical protein